MHTVRLRRKHTLLAVTALAATLSLTACQDDNDPSGGGEPGSSAPASDSGGSDSGGSSSDGGSDTGGGDGDGGNGTAGGGGDGESGGANGTAGGGGGNTPIDGEACTGVNVRATVQKVSRPVNHLVLKITNKGGKRCAAYFAPALRFDQAQAATRVLEESKPQAVVSVQPGESAYAAIGLSGADESSGQKPVGNLEVHFKGRNGKGSVGAPADIALPQATKIGQDSFVTYWQSDLQAALKY